MARGLLAEAGFAGTALDVMLGIEWVECYDPTTRLHYYDAVGDVTLISDKWGPSIGPAQIRSLRHPNLFPHPDTLRVAALLRDPEYNARAAWEISRHGTHFTPWSAYNSRAHEPHIGQDFELHAGHIRAHQWNL